MNPKEETALRDLYRSWSDERLVRATVIERDQFEPEAVAAMERELNKRGVTAQAAQEKAAALPPVSAPEASGPRRIAAMVTTYLQSSVIAFLMAAAAFSGLVLTELSTRALTHSETYYQTHPMPRLWGAVIAFLLSFAILKGVAWSLQRSSATAGMTGDDCKARAERNRAVLARVRYVPIVIFAACLLAALSPR